MDYIASLSYGKDSCTIPHVCFDVLNLPLTKLVTVDVMYSENISADYPEVEEFKLKTDELFKSRYGLVVEHIKADKTYIEQFYTIKKKSKNKQNQIYGFPYTLGAWCNGRLKLDVINKYKNNSQFWYIGYALDEKNPKRQEKIKNCINLNMYPLVKAQYTEQMCFDYVKKNGLLNPSYNNSYRDGCWFCHNQRIEVLKELRNNYPDKWQMLLNLEQDSPVSFKPNVTLKQLEQRFIQEDMQLNLFDFI